MKSRSRKNKYTWAKSPEDYLNQRLDKTANCWLWQGPVDKDGYGQCQSSKYGKQYRISRSHQLAYTVWVGKIPAGKIVCHHCDTPACCNSAHLYAGTWKTNVEDRVSRNRTYNKPRPNKYTEYIVAMHTIKSCMELAEELDMSFSRICQIWRSHGLTGKNIHQYPKHDSKGRFTNGS